jgi:regulatory protein
VITVTELRAKKGAAGVLLASLNNGEEVLLHEEVSASLGIREGTSLTEEQWASCVAASDRVRCRAEAGKALSRRPLTAMELNRLLRRRQFPAETIAVVVEELRAGGYINDSTYSKLFAESRSRRKAGPRAIEQGLRQRGVDRETAARASRSCTDEATVRQNARELLEKWNRSARQSDPRKRAQAAAAFLYRRGYEGELVREVVREVLKATPDE